MSSARPYRSRASASAGSTQVPVMTSWKSLKRWRRQASPSAPSGKASPRSHQAADASASDWTSVPEAPHGPALEPRERRVAAGEDALELAAEDGRRRRGLADGGEEAVRRAVEDADAALLLDEGVDRPEVGPRRPAAVVAEPPEDRDVAAELEGQGDAGPQPLLDVVALGVVEADGDAVGGDRRAVRPAPAVEVRGKGQLVGLRAACGRTFRSRRDAGAAAARRCGRRSRSCRRRAAGRRTSRRNSGGPRRSAGRGTRCRAGSCPAGGTSRPRPPSVRRGRAAGCPRTGRGPGARPTDKGRPRCGRR